MLLGRRDPAILALIGVHPKVMEAVLATEAGQASSYCLIPFPFRSFCNAKPVVVEMGAWRQAPEIKG